MSNQESLCRIKKNRRKSLEPKPLTIAFPIPERPSVTTSFTFDTVQNKGSSHCLINIRLYPQKGGRVAYKGDRKIKCNRNKQGTR